MEAIRSILLVLTILGALAVAGLVIVGGYDGRYEGDRMIKINRRGSEVFEWLLVADKREQWVAGLSHSDAPVSAPNPGVKWSEVYAVDGLDVERTIEVTQYVEDKRIGYKTSLEGVAFEIVYELGAHTTGRKTLITATYHVEWEGSWNKLVEPVLSSRVLSRIEGELARMKKVIEESAP
jgi:hypothetical protein